MAPPSIVRFERSGASRRERKRSEAWQPKQKTAGDRAQSAFCPSILPMSAADFKGKMSS